MTPLNWVETLGSFAILVFAHLLPFIYERGKSLFLQPQKLSAIISGVITLPHIIIVILAPDSSELYSSMGLRMMDYIPYFCLTYALGMVALYSGIYATKTNNNASQVSIKSIDTTGFMGTIIFLIIAYFLSFYFIIDSAGGITAFMLNFANRAELLAGTGVYYIIKVPASYLAIMLLVTLHCLKGRPNIIVVALVILMMMSIESILGGRRTPIQFLIFAFITYAIMNEKSKLFTPSSVMIAAVTAAIFYGLLALRYKLNPTADESQLSLLRVLVNASYNDIYIFILDYFDTAPLWHGAAFFDFMYRVVPMPGNAPPPSLDEGVYVYNLFLGRAVYPPMSLDYMYHNSWPANTYGNGYLNFGLPGIILFFFIKGAITGLAHRMCINTNLSVFFVFIYLFIVFAFQVSNQRITELLVILVGSSVIYIISSIIRGIDAATSAR